MSYLHTIEYTLQPVKSYVVIHNCSGCGSKSGFINTNRFRVNANGNKLDVWLVYQCSKCKHTLNVAIYERIKNSAVPKGEYEKFLQNDEILAEKYGKTLSFFVRNKLVVNTETQEYELFDSCKQPVAEACKYETGTYVKVMNPYQLQLRAEKVASLVFGLSRSTLKKEMDSGKLTVQKNANCWEMHIG